MTINTEIFAPPPPKKKNQKNKIVVFASEQQPWNMQGLFCCLAWWLLRRADSSRHRGLVSVATKRLSATIMFLYVPTCLHADERDTAITITERIVSQKRIWQRFSHSHLFADIHIHTFSGSCCCCCCCCCWRTMQAFFPPLFFACFCQLTKNHFSTLSTFLASFLDLAITC